jgi:hypothetical protein
MKTGPRSLENKMDEQPQRSETATEQVTASAIEILRIQKGDTVVVRAAASDPQQLAFINHVFFSLFQRHGLGPNDVHLLIIPANLDIAVLDEAAMKQQGWERPGRIKLAMPNGKFRP